MGVLKTFGIMLTGQVKCDICGMVIVDGTKQVYSRDKLPGTSNYYSNTKEAVGVGVFNTLYYGGKKRVLCEHCKRMEASAKNMEEAMNKRLEYSAKYNEELMHNQTGRDEEAIELERERLEIEREKLRLENESRANAIPPVSTVPVQQASFTPPVEENKPTPKVKKAHRFCPNCGSALKPNAHFCGGCGKGIG